MFNALQLVTVLDHLSAPVAVYSGPDFAIQFANAPMLNLLGRDSGVTGSLLKDVLPDGHSGLVMSDLIRFRNSKEETYTGDCHSRFYKDGALILHSCRQEFKVISREPEELILYTILDITEAVSAETPYEDRDRYNGNGHSTFESNSASRQALIGRFIAQAPAGICLLGGPELVYELVNPFYQQLFPGRKLLGRPVTEAVPEIAEGPLLGILRDVYRTGRTYEGKEAPFSLRSASGRVIERYFNFIYQARRAANNEIDGIIVFVIDVTETVLNRKKADEHEKQLTEMVMASPYGMMILEGKEMVIRVANQQIAHLWQKHLGEITGRKLLEALPEIEDQLFPKLLAEVYESGVSCGKQEGVLFIHAPEGDLKRHVSFFYDPLFDHEGNVRAVIVSCEDVTEKVESRRLLEAGHSELQMLNQKLASVNERLESVNRELLTTNLELIQTQKRLEDSISGYEETVHQMQSIVASAPFPIGVYQGRKMRIVMTNKALTDVWGKGDHVVGKLYSEVLPELESQNVYGQLDTVYTTGVPLHIRNQRIDLVVGGELKEFYFNYSFTPLLDRSGQVYGVMNTAADVTDLYIAKQNLERSEQNLHNIILQAPVAMSILSGPEHIISVANNKMIELWGKSAEAVMYRPVFEALPEARNQGLEALMENVYRHGETFQASEMPVSLVRNGHQEVVYQDFVYQPYRDAEGNVVGVIAITTDVTEHVRARKKIELSEAELRVTKKRLEAELEAGKELERQKDVFFGIASHELKTPLTSLTAIIQVAQAKLRNSADPFLAGAMNTANVQLKRMSSMVNSFLNISQLEGGKFALNREPVNLDDLVSQVIGEIKFAAGTHKVDYQSECAVVVYADKDKISSVTTNLVHNAIKYSPQAETVEVRCVISGKEAVVSVKDFGFGITPDDLPRIFQRYYRVRGENTQHISGFGIGLYLCAEIIERHGGKIRVDSEPGKGSTFYFSLPVAEQASHDQAADNG